MSVLDFFAVLDFPTSVTQDRDFFGVSVELVIPTAMELSDWRGLGGLLPPHTRQGVSQWDHLLGRQKQSCHFRFRCGQHDILHYLGDGEERSIPTGDGVFF